MHLLDNRSSSWIPGKDDRPLQHPRERGNSSTLGGENLVCPNEGSHSTNSAWLRVRGEGVEAVGTGGEIANSPDNSAALGTDDGLVGRQTQVTLV